MTNPPTHEPATVVIDDEPAPTDAARSTDATRSSAHANGSHVPGRVELGVVDLDSAPADVSETLPDDAVVNDDRSVTLPLLYPVALRVKKAGVIDDVEVTELTFRRMKGADQTAIATVPNDRVTVVLMSRLTGIAQVKMKAIYDEMDGEDIGRIARVLGSFTPSGRRTGR